MIRTTISIPQEYFNMLKIIQWDSNKKSLSSLISNIIKSYISDHQKNQRLRKLEKNYAKYAENFWSNRENFDKLESSLLWDIN